MKIYSKQILLLFTILAIITRATIRYSTFVYKIDYAISQVLISVDESKLIGLSSATADGIRNISIYSVK